MEYLAENGWEGDVGEEDDDGSMDEESSEGAIAEK